MLVFDPKYAEVGGLNAQRFLAQAESVQSTRDAWDLHNEEFQQKFESHMVTNAPARIPQEVYTEFDTNPMELIRADNLTLLNDLLPNARALPIGKIQLEHRRVSDSGVVMSSIGGQVPANLDKAEYDYDGSIKVIHQTGFGREWMEVEGQRTEAFDGLIDDQRNAVRGVMDHAVDHFYDGAKDADGRDITFKDRTASGIKNSSKTILVDLGNTESNPLNIDLTSTSTSSADIRNAFIAMRDRIRITNNIIAGITVYISAEMESNFERYFGTDAGDQGRTIMETLRQLAGIADIKVDRKLSGNELVMAVIGQGMDFIRPIVGMAITTTPIIRSKPFENYNFVTWANLGLDIRTDFAGRSGVLYARVAT